MAGVETTQEREQVKVWLQTPGSVDTVGLKSWLPQGNEQTAVDSYAVIYVK